MLETVYGIDLSLNHAGIVKLSLNGELLNFWFLSNTKSHLKNLGEHGYFLNFPKADDSQAFGVYRLNKWYEFFANHLMYDVPTYAGIEDNILGFQKSNRILQNWELGAIPRVLLLRAGSKIRLYSPKSIKKFAAHYGSAEKDEIEEAVKRRWGVSFSEYNPPMTAKSKGPNTGVSEDLADAYAIARLVITEVMLRNGDTTMPSLHPKEIEVFNTATKANPTNILGREWICASQKVQK